MCTNFLVASRVSVGISQALLAKFGNNYELFLSAIKPSYIGCDEEGYNLYAPTWAKVDPALKDRLTIDELTELDLIYYLLEDIHITKDNQLCTE